MRTRRLTLSSALCLALLSCGKYSWPPFHAELEAAFEAAKPSLLGIENQMIEDGISVLELDESIHQSPVLSEERIKEYRDLLEAAGIYVSAQRHDGTSYFDLVSQELGARRFYLQFVHSAGLAGGADCGDYSRGSPCGSCDHRVDSEWILRYKWSSPGARLDDPRCLPRRE